MSEPNQSKLAEVRRNRIELEEEKRRIVASAKREMGGSVIDLTKEPWYSIYRTELTEVEDKIATARQEENNALLDVLMNQSSQTNETLKALNRATNLLTESSERLNTITGVLLVLTAVLAVSGIGSYGLQLLNEVGFIGPEAITLTLMIVVVVVIFIFLAIRRLSRGVFGRFSKNKTQ